MKGLKVKKTYTFARRMFILIHQSIKSPDRFWPVFQSLAPVLPDAIRLHQVMPDASANKCTCLCEARSVGELRHFFDFHLKEFLMNVFIYLNNDFNMGLPKSKLYI
jgi:hypothetical protein